MFHTLVVDFLPCDWRLTARRPGSITDASPFLSCGCIYIDNQCFLFPCSRGSLRRHRNTPHNPFSRPEDPQGPSDMSLGYVGLLMLQRASEFSGRSPRTLSSTAKAAFEVELWRPLGVVPDTFCQNMMEVPKRQGFVKLFVGCLSVFSAHLSFLHIVFHPSSPVISYCLRLTWQHNVRLATLARLLLSAYP